MYKVVVFKQQIKKVLKRTNPVMMKLKAYLKTSITYKRLVDNDITDFDCFVIWKIQ